MAACLARLARLRQQKDLLDPARRTLNLAGAGMNSSPSAYPYMILAAGRVRDAGLVPPGPAAGVLAAAAPAPPAAPAPRLLQGTVVGRANPQRVVESQMSAPERPVRPGEAVTLSLE